MCCTVQSLLERIENLQRLCDKKEKFLQVQTTMSFIVMIIFSFLMCYCVAAVMVQSTKMILKFRETHIGNMEKGRRGKGGEEAQVTLERSRPGGTVNGLVSGDGLTTSVGLSCMVTCKAYYNTCTCYER